jgi:hypothetical protein
MNFNYQQPLHQHPFACVCAQCGLHLSPFGRASGLAHLVARRQCGGCRHCRCGGPDHRRAGEQRFGLGRVLHFVGWPAAARAQCLRPAPPHVDTGLLSSQIRPCAARRPSAAWIRSPCRVRWRAGWPERAFWQVAFCRLDATGHRDRRAGLFVAVVVQQKWAAGCPELRSLPGFAQAFCPGAVRPRWASCFSFQRQPRLACSLRKPRARRFMAVKLPRRWSAFPVSTAAALEGQRLCQLQARVGHADRPKLPWAHLA